jgi:carbamoyltransferase
LTHVLGLNFGHDAAATILRDGAIASYICRERFSRRKHAGGLDQASIDQALAVAGLDEHAIDWVAITSTQSTEMLVGLCPDLQIEFVGAEAIGLDSPLAEQIPLAALHDRLSFGLRKALNGDGYADLAPALRAVYAEADAYARGEVASIGWLDESIAMPHWTGTKLRGLAAQAAGTELLSERARNGFHYPVMVTLRGRRIPGVLVHHHMAHAAGVFYRAGFDTGAVLTHDGYAPSTSPSSGMFYYGSGNRLYPVMPHFLAVGALYDFVAWRLSLGAVGGAGKLMGLAPYGEPRFYRSELIGNWFDTPPSEPLMLQWFERCVAEAGAAGYDMSALGDPARITEPVNADIAASTQKLFEETYAVAVEQLHETLIAGGLATDALCLSGGCALNCPTNSRVLRESPFRRLYVDPSCADDGLAIGAAMHLWHNLLDAPVQPSVALQNQSPYLGPPTASGEIEAEIARRGASIVVRKVADAAKHAASLLARDEIVAWFEGGSEIGPRALGHRSLLADPRQPGNWRRVNAVKRREWWRPFAPAVLHDDAPDLFRGGLQDARYMLFTSMVTADALPAITHVDRSARVQTVTEQAGRYHALLQEFAALTGVPVVLNTSLNGPGEPIVEQPRDAINFLLATEVDCLMMGGYEFRRPPSIP